MDELDLAAISRKSTASVALLAMSLALPAQSMSVPPSAKIAVPAPGQPTERPLVLELDQRLSRPGTTFSFVAQNNRDDSAGHASSTSDRMHGSERSGAVKALVQQYHDGEYAAVANNGLSVLADEPQDAQLRLIIANSLAWSGRPGEAIRQYQLLEGSAYAREARLGFAHVSRWTGRPEVAARAYRAILADDPSHAEAADGLRLARRSLRPAVSLQLGHAQNSNDVNRISQGVGFRWRDASEDWQYELLASHLRESQQDLSIHQRDLTIRAEQGDQHPIRQLELSWQQSPAPRLFGVAVFKPKASPVGLTIGRVNWGKLALDARALRDGLTAAMVAVNLQQNSAIGEAAAAYHAYRVSDGNLVHAANLRLTPAWQPLRIPGLRLFTGVDARHSRFNDVRYWSPEEGHYHGFLGLTADKSTEQWQAYGSVQYGVPLTAESGTTWSASVGATRWLGETWALKFDVWAMDTPRNGGYQASSAMLRVEKLW